MLKPTTMRTKHVLKAPDKRIVFKSSDRKERTGRERESQEVRTVKYHLSVVERLVVVL